MSSSAVLWHGVGRVLAWVTLLFAVGTGPPQLWHVRVSFLLHSIVVVQNASGGRLNSQHLERALGDLDVCTSEILRLNEVTQE